MREIVGAGDARLAGGTAAKRAAFGQEAGAGRAMDCAIDPAAAQQGELAAFTMASTFVRLMSPCSAVMWGMMLEAGA